MSRTLFFNRQNANHVSFKCVQPVPIGNFPVQLFIQNTLIIDCVFFVEVGWWWFSKGKDFTIVIIFSQGV